jgi:two-component system, chemotaxis family, chemotaxis protein CheY
MALIMIVDDSTTMRQMVAFTLSSAGHQAMEAENGSAAIKLTKGNKFDLIITDVNMPEMNGIDLVRALRALPDCKFTPILVLTTEAGANMKEEGKAAGATGWIVKPFNPEVLLTALKKVLD